MPWASIRPWAWTLALIWITSKETTQNLSSSSAAWAHFDDEEEDESKQKSFDAHEEESCEESDVNNRFDHVIADVEAAQSSCLQLVVEDFKHWYSLTLTACILLWMILCRVIMSNASLRQK